MRISDWSSDVCSSDLTGGSTNHAIHLPAIARAAGIVIDWQDFDELSHAVPLLARVYPNGAGDVNHFHAVGGIGFIVRELLGAGLLHGDLLPVGGAMADYAGEPLLVNYDLHCQAAPAPARHAKLRRAVGPGAPAGWE